MGCEGCYWFSLNVKSIATLQPTWESICRYIFTGGEGCSQLPQGGVGGQVEGKETRPGVTVNDML